MLALYIIAGLVFILVVLLCIPVETSVRVDTDSGQKFNLRVSWLFGLINKNFGRRKSKPPFKARSASKKRKILIRPGLSLISKGFSAANLIRQLKKLAVDIYRQLTIREISGELLVGLEDPEYTGLLFAIIGPANALLNLHPRYDVNIRPIFDDEDIFEGNLNGTIKIQPIKLVVPVVRFASSRDVIKTGNRIIKERWGKRGKSR